MNLWRISAVEHHPLDLRAAHPNVAERAVIERMKLAYRRDACASDGVGAPPVAGRGNDRLGKEADDGRSAAGSGLKRAQAGAAGVVGRLGVADHELHHPLPLVRRKPCSQSNRGNVQGLRLSPLQDSEQIADLQGHRSYPPWPSL